MTALSLFVDAGSRYETAENVGVCTLIESLAYHSTTEQTRAQILKFVESIAAKVSVRLDRDVLHYDADVLRQHVPAMVDLMAATVARPRVEPDELRHLEQYLRLDIEEQMDDTRALLIDLVHTAAFSSAGLGNGLMVASDNLARLTPQHVRDYMSKYFIAPRMVLAAAGFDHDELVRIAQVAFARLPAGTKAPSQPARYTGGSAMVERRTDVERDAKHLRYFHLCYAFEGVPWSDPDMVPLAVLMPLMGGGEKFSQGGPGRGIHTRLYTRLLSPYQWFVERCSMFNHHYADTGIVGMYAKAVQEEKLEQDMTTEERGQRARSEAEHGLFNAARNASMLQKVMCAELARLGEDVTDMELMRSKNMLKSTLLHGLEPRAAVALDVGRQLVLSNKRITPEEFCEMIDAVTAADIARVSRRILASPVTVVAVGKRECLDALEPFENSQRFFEEIAEHKTQMPLQHDE